MKILLCNIPIRPTPDPYPPVACTSLCSYLIKYGYDPVFYDINAIRPSIDDISEYLMRERFDIIGISAVVSTSYLYTKNLADLIKTVSPHTQIVLGGNMAAAYEVILRKCKIDICVIGKGEKVLLDLVRHLEKHGNFDPASYGLNEIKNIAYLNLEGNTNFTGYGYERIATDDNTEQQPNYELLDKYSDINQYLVDPMTRYDFAYDKRSYEPHRHNKKMATIFTSRGCINKCTFCHRWIKGYKVIPVKDVIASIKNLIDKYNAGFFCISDECFGENKQWIDEFIDAIKDLDVLFQVGGARVSIVQRDPTVVKRLKDAGLTAIYFGVESGSDKILKIMEKNATKEENLKALKICSEAELYTIIQLVIGMPGENKETINETIEFLKMSSGDLPYFQEVSTNYLQSLPGTPCYELLRYHGFLGANIDDEEKYLLNVSDINASEFRHYINVSEEPLSEVKLWRMKIWTMNSINWLKQHNWKLPENSEEIFRKRNDPHGTTFNNIKYLLKHNVCLLKLISFMGEFFWKLVRIANCYSLYGLKKGFLIVMGIMKEEDQVVFKTEALSLRKILKEKQP